MSWRCMRLALRHASPMRKRRRKPEHWLGYMPGAVGELSREGFATVIVHCVGNRDHKRCWHQARLKLADLPDMTWEELCPWLRCMECGNAGYVNLAIDWSEKID